MSILWAGYEEIDLPYGTAFFATTTDSSKIRSGYSRFGLNLQSTSGRYRYSTPFAGGAVKSAWLSYYFYGGAGTPNLKAIGLANVSLGSGCPGIYVGLSNTAQNRFMICTWTGSTQTVLVAEAGASAAGLNKIDLQVTDYGETGTVNLYVNGILVATYTGDIRISGVTNLNGVAVYEHENVWGVVSEIIVADEDTRGFSLASTTVTGAGDANAWDGDGYGGLDETTLADVDKIYTNVADEEADFALGNLPSGTFEVVGARIAVRAIAPTGSTANTLKLGLRESSTSDLDAGQSVPAYWKTMERLMTQVNGSTLTTALIDSSQLAVKSAASA